MSKKYRVLVVDDDQDILDLLKYNLEKAGFKTRTEVNSEHAIDTAIKFKPDLIILDIMMSGLNGIELCREFRSLLQFKDTYIFFLTANSEPRVHETALENGGDDLIEKVIGLRVLSTKVRAVLVEKWKIHKQLNTVRAGDLKVNRRTGAVQVGDHQIVLSKTELDLLYFFAQNPKKQINSKQLIENLWGSNFFSTVQTLQHYLQNLSKKLDHRLRQISDDTYTFIPTGK